MHTKVNVALSHRLFIGTCHHIACSAYDLFQPLSPFFISPPYSVFYSNFICKTHLHNVWVVATSLSRTPSLNFTAE